MLAPQSGNFFGKVLNMGQRVLVNRSLGICALKAALLVRSNHCFSSIAPKRAAVLKTDLPLPSGTKL